MPRQRTEPPSPPPSRALPERVKSAQLPTRVDPLHDSSADVWARWSRDADLRATVRRREQELKNRELASQPLYPRECAEALAEDMKQVAPDWRAARPTLGAAWGRLLKAQPEMAPELVKRRESIITALFNNTPPELHPGLRDLRTLFDLHLTAHESASFMVGFASGRIHERQNVDDRGRLRQRRLPGPALTFGARAMRLHLDSGPKET